MQLLKKGDLLNASRDWLFTTDLRAVRDWLFTTDLRARKNGLCRRTYSESWRLAPEYYTLLLAGWLIDDEDGTQKRI